MKDIFSQILNYKEQEFKEGEYFEIILSSLSEKINPKELLIGKEYIITVNDYMTQPATRAFNFNQVHNNNIPMPCNTMVGRVLKSNNNMYYMKLRTETESWVGYVLKNSIIESEKYIRNG